MTTRSEFDPSLARNYYDLWGTYSDANELLYARVAELEAEMTIINRALSDEGVTSHQLRVRVAELEAQYGELIYAVATKYPDETRHQTALRYIQQAENREDSPACELKP